MSRILREGIAAMERGSCYIHSNAVNSGNRARLALDAPTCCNSGAWGHLRNSEEHPVSLPLWASGLFDQQPASPRLNRRSKNLADMIHIMILTMIYIMMAIMIASR